MSKDLMEVESELSHKVSETKGVPELQTQAHLADYLDKQTSKWTSIKSHPYAVFCVISMVWVLILTSFESQAGSVVISIGEFRKDFGYFIDGQWVLHSADQSMLSGIPLALQIIGQCTGSWLADRFGKKWVIYAAILISCAFVGMEFAAHNINLFIAGKSLNGLCLGIIQASAVSYVSDITPLALRGMSAALCNISFSIGPLVCFIINYFLSTHESAWSYKAIFASQWGFAAVSLVLMLLVPESPTYFILQDDVAKAEKAYRTLLGDPVAASRQTLIVKNTVLEARELAKDSTYIDCFKGSNLKRTTIAFMPFIMCPFSGVFFTGGYTTYFFQLSGFDEAKSFQYTCGAQAISIFGCIAALYIVDKVGRRNNLIYGLACIITCDFIIGGTATVSGTNSKALDACIGFMMLYGGVYNAGLGSVCYPICIENPTSALRTKTVAIGLISTNLASMVWSFVIPYIFNPDQANLGGKTMFIFAGFTVLSFVYAVLFQPETAGRTYEEIDEMYSNRVPLRKFKHYVTSVAKVDATVLDDGKPDATHVEKA